VGQFNLGSRDRYVTSAIRDYDCSMSLNDVVDYVRNCPIHWLWIFGAVGAIWFLVLVFGFILAYDLRKGRRSK
jgi:hypothetical protein